MVPAAPVTFSMMTGWPSEAFIRSEMTRASASVGPPAGKGTTMVTGRDGKVCACAAGMPLIAAAIAIPRTSRRMFRPPIASFDVPRPTQADIERAGSAMAHMGLLQPGHIAPQFRLREPKRYLALEHAVLARIGPRALTRDDKHESRSFELRPAQKPQQLAVGLRLG